MEKTTRTFDYTIGNTVVTIRMTDHCKSGTIYRTSEIVKVRRINKEDNHV